MAELSGRIALVTGAPAGVGPAIASRLAHAGAWVAVGFWRDLEGAKRLVDAIRAAGGRAMLVPGDVADPAQAWAAVEQVDLQWGPVDLVVEQSGAEASKESRIQNTEYRRNGADVGARSQEGGAGSDEEMAPGPVVRIDAVRQLLRAALPALRRSAVGCIVVVGPAGDSLREAMEMARELARSSPVEVRGVAIRAGDSVEDVATAVLESCLGGSRGR